MTETKLANIKFKNAGKTYYFASKFEVVKGDKVVVETARGLELGEVSRDLMPLDEFKLDTELKSILRIANENDLIKYEENKEKANESFKVCRRIIENSKIDMHLISCEYTLDRSKIIFMYTSEERVDFRELLKELATQFKCRIELRQVGTRDKAKMVGGIGICGMPICCSNSLGEFNGVSINMAKNQMLAINIEKISGMCGRLMCCLKYEDEMYSIEKKRFPKIGERVIYDKNEVKVIGLNILSELVKIDSSNGILFVPLNEVKTKKVKKDGSN